MDSNKPVTFGSKLSARNSSRKDLRKAPSTFSRTPIYYVSFSRQQRNCSLKFCKFSRAWDVYGLNFKEPHQLMEALTPHIYKCSKKENRYIKWEELMLLIRNKWKIARPLLWHLELVNYQAQSCQ